MLKLASFACVAALLAIPFGAAAAYETDTIRTSSGPLRITFIGHASLVLEHGATVIHVDPFGKLADYRTLPKADLVLVTHEHFDHLDREAIAAVSTGETTILCNAASAREGLKGIVMKNGDTKKAAGVTVEAVPAYNIVHTRPDGVPYHPKGVGNGYVLTVGDKRIYIAGDTENIPEMKRLKAIDIAFLPMNLPYTMTPEMAAAAAKSFMPKILYPYHFGDTDTSKIVSLLKDTPSIEVRLRKMK